MIRLNQKDTSLDIDGNKHSVDVSSTRAVHHRVGPTSSGISFRELPEASFEQIRLTCKHYLEKGAGSYSQTSKAARYLYDLSNEVIEMTNRMETKMEKKMELKNQQIESVNRLLDEYRSVFSSSNQMSPIQLLEELERVRQVNDHLTATLADERLRHAEVETDLYQMIDEYSKRVNKSLDRDRTHVQTVEVHIKEMQSTREQDEETIQQLRQLVQEQQEQIRMLSGKLSNNKIKMSKYKQTIQELETFKKSYFAVVQQQHSPSPVVPQPSIPPKSMTVSPQVKKSPVSILKETRTVVSSPSVEKQWEKQQQRVRITPTTTSVPSSDVSLKQRLDNLSQALLKQEQQQIQLLERAVKHSPNKHM